MISLYGHRYQPFLVISRLEIEHNELPPVNPLKFKFTVITELSRKWHLKNADMKKTFYVIQFLNHKQLKYVRTFWDTLYYITLIEE